MISIYRKDHFSSLLDLIHIMITVPVAIADSPLHTSVGMLTQSEYILRMGGGVSFGRKQERVRMVIQR